MNSIYLPDHQLKLLILITTHFSQSHRRFLEDCWPNLVSQPLIIQIFIFTSQKILKNLFSILIITVNSIFPKFNYTKPTTLMIQTDHYDHNEERQIGAKSVMHDPRMQCIFQNYEWIMRLNPDVIVFDTRRIVKMMRIPHLDAMTCNCNWRIAKEYNQTSAESIVLAKPWPKKEYKEFGPWEHPIVMTDFIIFRPRAIAVNQTHSHVNAEYDMTNLLQESKNIAILSTTQYKHCRVNSDEVKHVHDLRVCQRHNWLSRCVVDCSKIIDNM